MPSGKGMKQSLWNTSGCFVTDMPQCTTEKKGRAYLRVIENFPITTLSVQAMSAKLFLPLSTLTSWGFFVQFSIAIVLPCNIIIMQKKEGDKHMSNTRAVLCISFIIIENYSQSLPLSSYIRERSFFTENFWRRPECYVLILCFDLKPKHLRPGNATSQRPLTPR